MKPFLGLSVLAVMLVASAVQADELDFGDQSSATLTGKAWKSLVGMSYKNAIAYAKKCVELYEKDAVQMQKELKAPVPSDDKEAVFKKWALNDVGTCFYIMGQALEKRNKKTEALASYRQLVEKTPYAQCWDPQGWFWKPADIAKKRIKALEADAKK